MNEDLFDFEGNEEQTNTDDMFDFSELEQTTNKENTGEESGEETTEEVVTEETMTETPEEVVTEETTVVDEDEGIDLSELLNELEDEVDASNKELDKIEATGEDVGMLRDSLKKMEDQIKKLNNTNADLKFRNAELEAFSLEDSDPKMMILYKNFSKAKDGDDKSKTRVISTLKDMIYEITGEDFDETKTNQDIDILTASEMYNNEINPNFKKQNEDDGFEIMI